MEDGELVSRVLALIAAGEPGATALLDGSDAVVAAHLRTFVDFMGAGGATPAPCACGTPVDLLIDDAVRLIAASKDPSLGESTAGTLVARSAAVDPATPLGSFGRYLAVEAALATARLDLADELRALDGPTPYEVWAGHPYAAVMLACAARADIFTGNIAAAVALTEGTFGDDLAGHLVRATRAVAAGNAADVDTMRALVAEVSAAGVEPSGHLGRGIHLLLAFGVIALGDVHGAVGHLLGAGGGADLEGLTVIDRALGYELLVAAAVEEDDLVSAEAWLERAQRWAEHRAAAPTIARIRARISILAGDAAGAESQAALAIGLAAAEGRVVEQAEGEILLGRARIAAHRVPQATRDLRAAVVAGDRTGFAAVRFAATRELRPVRRRLPPPAGSGPDSLSERELDVAELILAGADNAAIAAELHLSAATVRTHATRVLTAYGVATRIALLAVTREQPSVPCCPADLTARQAEVAALVAAGRSNNDVAQRLGISVKSVERHVTEILQRWDLRSRFELAHHWWELEGHRVRE